MTDLEHTYLVESIKTTRSQRIFGAVAAIGTALLGVVLLVNAFKKRR